MQPAHRRRVPAALLALAAACASGGAAKQLRPADAAQVPEGAPGEAIAELDGVAVRVAIDDWRGQPKDLEQRLTPVDVTVANGRGRPIRIGPEAFELVPQDRSPLRVLTQDEVATSLRTLTGFRARPAPRSGAVHGPTFPGYDSPTPYAGQPRSPVPAPDQWYETQDPSGELAAGRQTSLLLFFDTPASSLRAATFVVHVTDADGREVGTLKLPFDRE